MADATTRRRLVTAMSRLEALRERNDQQRALLRGAAGQMADAATRFVAGIHDQVLAGDNAAAHQARRALLGRYRARQIVGAE